jgi:RES domain-containing protein
MRIWRISEFADLSGDGGVGARGRWNNKGVPIVYCTDHPSTALLEIIVHFDAADLPSTYQLLEIEAADNIAIHQPDLPNDWRDKASLTRSIWSQFAANGQAALMRVPSVIMPKAENYLLNPAHPDAVQIRITQIWRYPFDSRLLS